MNSEYALYLDMDGVFCDWVADVEKLFPDFHKINGLYATDIKREDHAIIRQNMVDAILADKTFWTDMSWMPDGKQLWQFINSNYDKSNMAVLTAPMPKDDRCESDKLVWVKKNFGELKFFCDVEKQNYVGRLPGALQILIDDREKNIKDWEEAGGIAILHVSAADTIDKLKKIMTKEEISNNEVRKPRFDLYNFLTENDN